MTDNASSLVADYLQLREDKDAPVVGEPRLLITATRAASGLHLRIDHGRTITSGDDLSLTVVAVVIPLERTSQCKAIDV